MVIAALTTVVFSPAEKGLAKGKGGAAQGIANPGFEEISTDGSIPGWTQWYSSTGFSRTEQLSYEGTASLEINDPTSDASYWLFSQHLPSAAGDTWSVTGAVYTESGNYELNIAYFDASGNMLTYTSHDVSGYGKQWTETETRGVAPEGTAEVSVFVYSGLGAKAHGYIDHVALTKQVEQAPLVQTGATTNLGEVVKAPLTVGAEIATNANGENEVYFALNGSPSTFYVMDAENGQVKYSQKIDGMTHLYGITQASDHNVYFMGVDDGMLYRYIPTEKRIEQLGKNPSNPWVWDLEATRDGKLYGATYGESGSKVFEYDIATASFRDLGAIQTMPEQVYARGLGVTDQYIYVAVGIPEALIRVNRITGEQTEIVLPYSGQTRMAADVWAYNGKLFVRDESSTLFVLDEATGTWIQTLRFKATISPPSPYSNNLIYYKVDGTLYQYDMSAGQTQTISGLPTLPVSTPVKFNWITPTSGEKAGKPVLAIMLEFSEYMLYDPTDGWFKTVPLNAEPSGLEIQSLETGPDGKLYIGGYQKAVSVFDPKKGRIESSSSLFPQAEGVGFLNGDVYFGTYGGAVIYRYNPSEPFRFTGAEGDNPALVYDIGSGQDRPFAFASGDNKLFIGTVPEYGGLGGALTVYDDSTGLWTTYDDVVDKQSIIGLAYKDGKLYGGTSVWGGLGIQPVADQAKMFVWDVQTGTKLSEFTLNIPGIDQAPKMIGGLSFGPDGLLYGVVSGTVFAMDPDTHAIVKSKKIFDSNYVNNSTWRPYYIRWGADGLMYTTVGRNITVIDPATLDYSVLVQGVSLMTIGADGDIYYASGAHLMKLDVKSKKAKKDK